MIPQYAVLNNAVVLMHMAVQQKKNSAQQMEQIIVVLAKRNIIGKMGRVLRGRKNVIL
tara:strand:- start:541 stop:714 length:174 start_codon:yes stop_codon:yes gene_type:complete